MKKIVMWSVLVLGVAGLANVQAATVDLLGNGTSTNGFYYWNDTANWNYAGNLPGVADSPRLRYVGKEKVFLTTDQMVSQLTANTDVAAQIGGSGKLTLTTYLLLTNSTLDVRGDVSIVVSNRMRFGGSTALSLFDNAQITAKVSIDAAASLFTITLNGNSAYYNLMAPVLGAANIAAGSKYVLNDNSTMNGNTLTAQELNDSWLIYNTKFYLNDSAAITLQTSANNAADIATYISAGKILINDSTTAVSGVDYTYNAGTGVLQVIPEPATLGMMGVAGVLIIMIRRRILRS